MDAPFTNRVSNPVPNRLRALHVQVPILAIRIAILLHVLSLSLAFSLLLEALAFFSWLDALALSLLLEAVAFVACLKPLLFPLSEAFVFCLFALCSCIHCFLLSCSIVLTLVCPWVTIPTILQRYNLTHLLLSSFLSPFSACRNKVILQMRTYTVYLRIGEHIHTSSKKLAVCRRMCLSSVNSKKFRFSRSWFELISRISASSLLN